MPRQVQSIFILIALFAAGLAASACTQPSAKPTETPLQPTADYPTDGLWQGTNQHGADTKKKETIEFQVKHSQISSFQISFDCSATIEDSVALRSEQPPKIGQGLVSVVLDSVQQAGNHGSYDLNVTFDSSSAARAEVHFRPDGSACNGKRFTFVFDLSNAIGPEGREGRWEMPINVADIFLGLGNNPVKGFDFTVAQGYLTKAEIMLPFKDANCADVINNFAQAFAKEVPLKDDGFTAQYSQQGVNVTLAGKFTSPTRASGTVQAEGDGPCGKVSLNGKWSANFRSPLKPASAAPDAASTPPAANSSPAAPSATPRKSGLYSPFDVLDQFFQALNDKNVDAAMNLVDENVTYSVGPAKGVGKSNLAAYLSTQVKRGLVIEVSKINAIGNVLTFSTTVNGAINGDNTVILDDNGKIVTLTLK